MMRSVIPAVTALLLIALPAHGQGYSFGTQPDSIFAPPQRITCMTDRQIRDAVADEGFTNIYLNVPDDGRVEVRATRDGWVYLLDYNYCRGYIVSGGRLRPAT